MMFYHRTGRASMCVSTGDPAPLLLLPHPSSLSLRNPTSAAAILGQSTVPTTSLPTAVKHASESRKRRPECDGGRTRAAPAAAAASKLTSATCNHVQTRRAAATLCFVNRDHCMHVVYSSLSLSRARALALSHNSWCRARSALSTGADSIPS